MPPFYLRIILLLVTDPTSVKMGCQDLMEFRYFDIQYKLIDLSRRIKNLADLHISFNPFGKITSGIVCLRAQFLFNELACFGVTLKKINLSSAQFKI